MSQGIILTDVSLRLPGIVDDPVAVDEHDLYPPDFLFAILSEVPRSNLAFRIFFLADNLRLDDSTSLSDSSSYVKVPNPMSFPLCGGGFHIG